MTTHKTNKLITKKTKSTIPSIVGTKASQARAEAIRIAQLSNKKAPAKKRAEAPKTLTNTYDTTASGLKRRPAWDLRGKVEDMTELYKLNNQRLEELRNYKRELEVTKEEKESQEKEAIQRASTLRTELQTIERNHTAEIQDLNAKQRIEYQKLEDENLNYSRRVDTRAIEVCDAQHRLDKCLAELQQYQSENDRLREADISITDREESIQKKKKDIEAATLIVSNYQSKLKDAHAVRDRLLNTIKELEDNAPRRV
ncbi:hypothetical protein BDB01DRAFT_716170 [Pilobolus umbonatus]|nr:hypothetical protein BDB01DRAFT_716170 [Pilobolus umbonatus]